MACSRLSYGILAVMMCLALITSISAAHRCDTCNNARCQEVCGGSLGVVGKRTLPRYPDFAAYIQDQIQKREPESCGMLDIYRAVPPSCYAKLDWLVSKAEDYLLHDE
ncbi:uncharacterized protein LOC119744483 [Patiria miniata]|uniref:Uncharacterized protein n=1 Tax=Patiria miniata TaxID=46514 RepID=A0A914BLK9_PATMI|nr:uncharacterized protein LOC119744483 [Patiria miniata]